MQMSTLNCTDEPPRVHDPLGSRARLTRSAMAQSARGSPQTRSRSFHSVGQRERIRLPPSRTACGAEALDLGGDAVECRSPERVAPDDPVAGVRLDRPAPRVEVLDERDDRRGPQVGHEADRPQLGGLELGQGRPERLGVGPFADHRCRPGPARSSGDRPARRPTRRCPRSRRPASSSSTGSPSASPADVPPVRVQELERDRPGGRRVEPVERRPPGSSALVERRPRPAPRLRGSGGP